MPTSAGPDVANRAAHRRRFAVILHADVAGSTALVQRDETVAHVRITGGFALLSGVIARYGGIVHEVRGDALLAEFERPSDAACAALAFQSENVARNETLADDVRPELRIGISLGEVVVADGTVTGPGVVLAQRLEQIAERNAVCLQSAVREAIPRRLPFEYDNLGEQRLKGFDEPVRAYRVALAGDAAVPPPEAGRTPSDGPREARGRRRAAALAGAAVLVLGSAFVGWRAMQSDSDTGTEPVATATPSRADKPSIAVLPFRNLSNDPEQEYFSDGLTHDLLTDLSRVSSLIVIARNSSFAYKGRSVNVQQVGRELGARYVLEGSVQRSGGRVRINAQLVDARSGTQLWANRYDRDLTDVFTLQDEVTQTIVHALAVSLTADDQARRARRAEIDPDAYDILLRGNERLQRFNAEDVEAARALYKQAIALEPRYARAHANVAYTHALALILGWSRDREESLRASEAAIEEALALDDRIPEAWFSLGIVLVAQHRVDEAIAAVRRSIEMDPNYADGYAMLCGHLTYAGRPQEALVAISTAMRLNPRYSAVYLWMHGRALFLLERYAEAAALLEEAVRRNAAFDQAQLVLAATYAQMGLQQDAEWAAEELLSLRPEFSLAKEREEKPFQRERDMELYIGGLRKAGLPP